MYPRRCFYKLEIWTKEDNTKTISNIRYKNIINDAIKRNRVAHFWTHPHNFITAPDSKKYLKGCAKKFRKKLNLMN